MINNEPDILTKVFQNEKETTTNTTPETSWMPKNPPSAAVQTAPVRRVGSMTLGVCLITAGIFFLCYHFLPNFDAQLVLKLAPAAGLILLGGEVLYYAAKPQRGKYDFISVFICLVLMACCFGLTLFPLVWDEIDPQNQIVAKNLSDDYQQQVYEQIQKDVPDIRLKDMGCGLSLYRYNIEGEKLTADNTKMLELNFWLQGPYDSAEAFAKDCRRLTDVIQKMEVQPTQVGFFCRGFSDADKDLSSGTLTQKANYELYLNGAVQLDWTAAEMAKETDVHSLIDEENELEEENAEREEMDRAMNDMGEESSDSAM